MIDSSSTEHCRNNNNNNTNNSNSSSNNNETYGFTNTGPATTTIMAGSEREENNHESPLMVDGRENEEIFQRALLTTLFFLFILFRRNFLDYRMLEDSSIRHLISWSENGDLFSVTNPTSFSRTVLPQYFKHNNWQSFVRQLNMYGFHKVNDMIHSNLTTESQNWEFKHPHFRRGAVEDLKNIKRKSAKSRHHLQHRPPLSAYPNEGDEYLYGPMYKHILEMEERLHNMIKAYEVLHVQTTSLKSLLSGQQKVNFKFFLLPNIFVISVDGLKQQILKLQELSNNILLPPSASNEYSNNDISQDSSSFSPLAVSSASSSSPSSRLEKFSQQQAGEQQQQQQQQQPSRFNPDPLPTKSMQGVVHHNKGNIRIPQPQQVRTQQQHELPQSQTRLPSISMFGTNISSSNTTATTPMSSTTATALRPLVGYSGSSHIGPPDKSNSKSASTSPLLDGFSRRTSSEHYSTIRRASNEQMSSYKQEGQHVSPRPMTTSLLSLGTHSQLLNPASDNED
ncbi:hypothetical protein INT45_007439, partial [Circinella minor]